MELPSYERPRARQNTLHLSLPDVLEKQIREVAYRKRRYVSHLCRYLIEMGLEKLAAEDEVVAAAMAEAKATADAEAAHAPAGD